MDCHKCFCILCNIDHFSIEKELNKVQTCRLNIAQNFKANSVKVVLVETFCSFVLLLFFLLFQENVLCYSLFIVSLQVFFSWFNWSCLDSYIIKQRYFKISKFSSVQAFPSWSLGVLGLLGRLALKYTESGGTLMQTKQVHIEIYNKYTIEATYNRGTFTRNIPFAPSLLRTIQVYCKSSREGLLTRPLPVQLFNIKLSIQEIQSQHTIVQYNVFI